jgi:flavin-binding protein dodecin
VLATRFLAQEGLLEGLAMLRWLLVGPTPYWSAGYARVELPTLRERAAVMTDGVYRVTEVIGVSSESWEAAARSAVETAAKTVRDLRIAEVIKQDVAIEDGTIKHYRVRLAISFQYESGD